jgi:hypothetical protein
LPTYRLTDWIIVQPVEYLRRNEYEGLPRLTMPRELPRHGTLNNQEVNQNVVRGFGGLAAYRRKVDMTASDPKRPFRRS